MKLRTFIKTGVFSLVIAAIALCGLRQAKAEDQAGTDPFVETWLGMLANAQQRTYLVTVTVPASDKTAITLRFGAPRDCIISGKLSSKEGNTLTVSPRDTTGGYCDYFITGKIVLTKSDADRLRINLSDETGNRKESGILRRAQSSSVKAPAPAKLSKKK